jgi:hypothetical protein
MVTVRASGFVEPCIPTRAHKPPAEPDWVHEIKHDGYRLQVRRDSAGVRLFTRRGYDWSGRYPAIVRTATLLAAIAFTPDGEAVVCGPDGVAVFDALHRPAPLAETGEINRIRRRFAKKKPFRPLRSPAAEVQRWVRPGQWSGVVRGSCGREKRHRHPTGLRAM